MKEYSAGCFMGAVQGLSEATSLPVLSMVRITDSTGRPEIKRGMPKVIVLVFVYVFCATF